MATDVLFTTFGSLGDVLPYIAVGKRLLASRVSVTLATSLYHKEIVESNGLKFFHARPDLDKDEEIAEETVRKIMDQRNGSEYVLRELIMNNVKEMYEDFHEASDGVSLVVTHPLTYGAIAAARKRNLPWIATVLSPASMWSAYDPPKMPRAPLLPLIRQVLGPTMSRTLISAAKQQTYSWAKPYRNLQKELGLSVIQGNPFFEGQFSSLKNLALFSSIFASPQPDWPPHTVATGFPFLEPMKGTLTLAKATFNNKQLRDFLATGPAPIVFTLGSSAVWDAGQFYINSVEAAHRLGKRAVLLVGSSPRTKLPDKLGANVIALEYESHAHLFPFAAAIVHQGGIGTTAQALRAGKPQVVMPYSHDQFDNANRVIALKTGLSISRRKYNGATAADVIRKVLDTTTFETAAEVGRQIRDEDGAQLAADEIMATLKAAKASHKA